MLRTLLGQCKRGKQGSEALNLATVVRLGSQGYGEKERGVFDAAQGMRVIPAEVDQLSSGQLALPGVARQNDSTFNTLNGNFSGDRMRRHRVASRHDDPYHLEVVRLEKRVRACL